MPTAASLHHLLGLPCNIVSWVHSFLRFCLILPLPALPAGTGFSAACLPACHNLPAASIGHTYLMSLPAWVWIDLFSAWRCTALTSASWVGAAVPHLLSSYHSPLLDFSGCRFLVVRFLLIRSGWWVHYFTWAHSTCIFKCSIHSSKCISAMSCSST